MLCQLSVCMLDPPAVLTCQSLRLGHDYTAGRRNTRAQTICTLKRRCKHSKDRPTPRRLPPATAAARHPRRPTPRAPRRRRLPPPAHPHLLRQTHPHPQAHPRLRQPHRQHQAVRYTVMSLEAQLICILILSDALLHRAAAFHSLLHAPLSAGQPDGAGIILCLRA